MKYPSTPFIALALAISAWPLGAQENAPQRPPEGASRDGGGPRPGGEGQRPAAGLFGLLDANHDGALDPGELAKAGEALRKLDRNNDQKITPDEMRVPSEGQRPPQTQGGEIRRPGGEGERAERPRPEGGQRAEQPRGDGDRARRPEGGEQRSPRAEGSREQRPQGEGARDRGPQATGGDRARQPDHGDRQAQRSSQGRPPAMRPPQQGSAPMAEDRRGPDQHRMQPPRPQGPGTMMSRRDQTGPQFSPQRHFQPPTMPGGSGGQRPPMNAPGTGNSQGPQHRPHDGPPSDAQRPPGPPPGAF